MVTHPAEGRLEEGEVVGGGDLCQYLDGLKVCLCPVTFAEPEKWMVNKRNRRGSAVRSQISIAPVFSEWEKHTKKCMKENLQFSETGIGVIAASFLDLILCKLVFSGQHTARDGVEGIETNVVVLEAREQLGGDRTGDRVVHSLVHRRTDVSVLLANLVNLGDVPCRVV